MTFHVYTRMPHILVLYYFILFTQTSTPPLPRLFLKVLDPPLEKAKREITHWDEVMCKHFKNRKSYDLLS